MSALRKNDRRHFLICWHSKHASSSSSSLESDDHTNTTALEQANLQAAGAAPLFLSLSLSHACRSDVIHSDRTANCTDEKEKGEQVMHLMETNHSLGLEYSLSSPRIETTRRRRLNSILQNCMRRVEYITEAKVQKETIFLSNDAHDIVI